MRYVRKNGLWLEIYCSDCMRLKKLPPGKIPARLKDDLPIRFAAAFFRCRACGSKNIRSCAVRIRGKNPWRNL